MALKVHCVRSNHARDFHGDGVLRVGVSKRLHNSSLADCLQFGFCLHDGHGLIAESEVRAFAARFRAVQRGDIREAAVETAGPKLAQSDVLRVQIPEVGRGFATFVPRQS